MQVAYTTAEIAALVGAPRTAGTATRPVTDIAALSLARAGDLSFLGNVKYKAQVAGCAATAVLLPLDYPGEPQPGQVFIFVENPSVALARVCARLEQALWPKPAPGIHPSAVVAPTARVDATAHLGPLCVVEAGAQIGAGSVLQGSVFVGRLTPLFGVVPERIDHFMEKGSRAAQHRFGAGDVGLDGDAFAKEVTRGRRFLRAGEILERVDRVAGDAKPD